MPQPVRVAVLGYGLAGRVFHCPFISAVPGLSLAAIVQRHGDEAQEMYPQSRILRSAEAAFDDAEIDLIVVGTPNDTHEAFALAALRAGKHVVVDKPLAPSSTAVRGLIDAAQAAKKLLIPFHNRRWDGDFLTVQQMLAENRLGRLARFITQWDRFRPVCRAGTWKESAGDGHGLLQDLGPHLLDQALVLFGVPGRMTADVRHDRKGTAIEDGWDIVLSYDRPDGSPFHVEAHASMIAADPAPRFRVHGTHGSFTKHGLDPQEAHLVADGRHPPQMDSSVPWIQESESAWGTLTLAPDPNEPAQLTRTSVPTRMGDYRLFYGAVRDAILGVGKPPVAPEDAFRVARLIELARQSSHERRTLEVDLAPS